MGSVCPVSTSRSSDRDLRDEERSGRADDLERPADGRDPVLELAIPGASTPVCAADPIVAGSDAERDSPQLAPTLARVADAEGRWYPTRNPPHPFANDRAS